VHRYVATASRGESLFQELAYELETYLASSGTNNTDKMSRHDLLEIRGLLLPIVSVDLKERGNPLYEDMRVQGMLFTNMSKLNEAMNHISNAQVDNILKEQLKIAKKDQENNARQVETLATLEKAAVDQATKSHEQVDYEYAEEEQKLLDQKKELDRQLEQLAVARTKAKADIDYNKKLNLEIAARLKDQLDEHNKRVHEENVRRLKLALELRDTDKLALILFQNAMKVHDPRNQVTWEEFNQQKDEFFNILDSVLQEDESGIQEWIEMKWSEIETKFYGK
jgi:hypothetical protein